MTAERGSERASESLVGRMALGGWLVQVGWVARLMLGKISS